jgi:hypothetical protein
MSTAQIENLMKSKNIVGAIEECISQEQYSLGMLIYKIYESNHLLDPKFHSVFKQLNSYTQNSPNDGKDISVSENIVESREDIVDTLVSDSEHCLTKKTRLMLLSNWCDSKILCDIWNKMSKGNYTWNNLQLVWEEPCDWYVVINKPPSNISPPLEKTILFHMEPNMKNNKQIWGEWAVPPKEKLKFCGTHELSYNNNEWHISKTYNQLLSEKIVKNTSLSQTLSSIMSDKYMDKGHILRVDFVKFLERKGVNVHVFGGNKFDWKVYKGTLPYHQKDEGLFQYKYTFNAENNEIKNYYTEKIIDGILSECLTFYWGCPNLEEFIDSRAFVRLNLIDFEHDLCIIQRAIEENWWEQRLPYIREAKQKILNELSLFPRLERILSGN